MEPAERTINPYLLFRPDTSAYNMAMLRAISPLDLGPTTMSMRIPKTTSPAPHGSTSSENSLLNSSSDYFYPRNQIPSLTATNTQSISSSSQASTPLSTKNRNKKQIKSYRDIIPPALRSRTTLRYLGFRPYTARKIYKNYIDTIRDPHSVGACSYNFITAYNMELGKLNRDTFSHMNLSELGIATEMQDLIVGKWHFALSDNETAFNLIDAEMKTRWEVLSTVYWDDGYELDCGSDSEDDGDDSDSEDEAPDRRGFKAVTVKRPWSRWNRDQMIS